MEGGADVGPGPPLLLLLHRHHLLQQMADKGNQGLASARSGLQVAGVGTIVLGHGGFSWTLALRGLSS